LYRFLPEDYWKTRAGLPGARFFCHPARRGVVITASKRDAVPLFQPHHIRAAHLEDHAYAIGFSG
jgi:hypothetical protein